MSPTSVVALAGLGLLVVGWLATAMMRPGPGRAVIEWVATTGLFVALAGWFTGLALGAHADDRTLLLVPFGFLAALFGAGTLVSLFKTLAQARGRTSQPAHTGD